MAEEKSSEIVPISHQAWSLTSGDLVARGLQELKAGPIRRPIIVISGHLEMDASDVITQTLRAEGHSVEAVCTDSVENSRADVAKLISQKNNAVLILLSWSYWYLYGKQLAQIQTLRTFVLSFCPTDTEYPHPDAMWPKSRAYSPEIHPTTCSNEFIEAVNLLALGQDLPRSSIGLFLWHEEEQLGQAIKIHFPPGNLWSQLQIVFASRLILNQNFTLEHWGHDRSALIVVTEKVWNLIGTRLAAYTNLKTLVILSTEHTAYLKSALAGPTAYIAMSEAFDLHEDQKSLIATDSLISTIRSLAGHIAHHRDPNVSKYIQEIMF